MDSKETEKTPITVSKSFLTFGPTLHYSHRNVQRCWILAIVVYGLCCIFWSKMATGSFWSFNVESVPTSDFWRLDQSLVTGVSIFEYPWQILVLGLLMGVLAIAPVLISQLMSFQHCLPFILELIVLANLPGFAIFLLASCFAVASRPLRFRSRFIAIALCMAPQLIYWSYFGGARTIEPIEWGFSFAPWICAWLDSLIIAGLVLGIGHFTRYRPGLVWIFTSLTLIFAVVIFEVAIGFDELDYQLYVVKNNPEHVDEFRDNSITKALDQTTRDPDIRRYLQSFFYPSDSEALRTELKREILAQLTYDRWPSWFIVPQEFEYEAKRKAMIAQYDLFIAKRPNSERMPITLYYKALLSEYSPDIRRLEEEEILHFYSDYPQERSAKIWYALYRDFGSSPESLEARWRIAKLWAGRGIFDEADALLEEAQEMIGERLELLGVQVEQSESLFGLFERPADTVMTIPRLNELNRRIAHLRVLIGPENKTTEADSTKYLEQFVMLNPYTLDYPRRLDRLLEQTEEDNPLYDNIWLAKIKLIDNKVLRADILSELHNKYKNTDGGIQSLYELGLLRINLWRQQDSSNPELEQSFLEQARTTLTRFIELYPESSYVEQVKENLDGLPASQT